MFTQNKERTDGACFLESEKSQIVVNFAIEKVLKWRSFVVSQVLQHQVIYSTSNIQGQKRCEAKKNCLRHRPIHWYQFGINIDDFLHFSSGHGKKFTKLIGITKQNFLCGWHTSSLDFLVSSSWIRFVSKNSTETPGFFYFFYEIS